MISRRRFLATTSLAFASLQQYSRAAGTDRVISPLGPLKPDPAGLLDLPEGFTYRVISRAGQTMTDGLKTPGKPDGMAAFAGKDGKVVLVRNHELALAMTRLGPFENNLKLPSSIDPTLSHDPGEGGRQPHLGGTTNLVFDPATGEKVAEFLSLTGTDRNCAGGPMPWGSWITCEEPADLNTPRGRKHGWCFEVEATETPGLQKAVALKALGRFRHEAVALDPATGILYLTEDRTDGLLYRFVPETPRDFTRGQLQALAVVDRPSADLRNYNPAATWPKEGESMKVTWIDVDNPEAPLDDLRFRGFEAGAARFARGEGIHFSDEGIFICCTDGGPDRRGQLFRLHPSESAESHDRLELFLQSTADDILTNGDNLCPAPWGGVVVCEDLVDSSFASHTHVRCVTPEGKIHTLARNAKNNSEFAGCCFSPDGKWMFVNLQGMGLTFAITGPWT